jgi:hypothetical protein
MFFHSALHTPHSAFGTLRTPHSALGTAATRIVKERKRRPGAVPGLLCPFAIISWLSSVKLVTPASYNLKRG